MFQEIIQVVSFESRGCLYGHFPPVEPRKAEQFANLVFPEANILLWVKDSVLIHPPQQVANVPVAVVRTMRCHCGDEIFQQLEVALSTEGAGCCIHASISILRNADDSDFPKASLLSDRDAPPFSAPCSTNFSASTLGTSKRSTLPVTIPSKCCLTRSAVTS